MFPLRRMPLSGYQVESLESGVVIAHFLQHISQKTPGVPTYCNR